MGNSFGSKNKKTTKVMKINGETIKLKTPVRAEEVVKDYPRHVLLESEAVKHYGIRAKPLQPQQNLEAKRLYFLVELPEVAKEIVPRRVRSGINMSAKDRLESLMLSRRSVSDLTILKPIISNSSSLPEEEGEGGGIMRMKVKLPRAEVEKLMKESKDDDEIARKIRDLCMANTEKQQQIMQHCKIKNNDNGNERFGGRFKARQKRVSFMPISEGGSQITVAS